MNEERNDLRSFEASFGELEELVRRLEGGALTLDESLAHYEKGVLALRRCYRILEVAEKRLELLVKDGEGGVTTRAVDLNELRGEARGAAKVAMAGAAVVTSESGKVAAVAAFAAGLETPAPPPPQPPPQVMHTPVPASTPQPAAARAPQRPAGSGERPAATSGRAAIQAPGAAPAPKTGKQPPQGGGGASLFGDA